MISKRMITFSSFIITLLILFIFIPYRTGTLENKCVKSLISSSEKITRTLNTFEKGKNIKNKNLTGFLNQIRKKYPDLAIAAIIDNKNSVIIEGKNDRFVKDNKTFDSILNNFIKGNYKISGNNKYLTKYYNQMKYYIFTKKITGGKILIIFPYKLSKKLIIGLLLEISLIIIFSIILTSLFYIYNKKNVKESAYGPYKIINVNQRDTYITDEKIIRNVSNLAADSLNDYCFELFNKISFKYSSRAISLYLMNNNTQKLDKAYELKGNSFIRIDTKNFESMDIQNGISEELKKSAIVILEKGKKLILPILYGDSLLGTISIIRDEGFKGGEINNIKTLLREIARPLSENLLLNDIVVDKETGLYSKTYFKLKYDEQRKLFQNMGNQFAIFVISILGEEADIEPEDQTIIIKSISSKILENLKDDDIICAYNDHFVILIPRLNLQESIETGKNILDSLCNVMVKAKKKVILKTKPYIGIASTDSIGKDDDLIQAAFENIKYAQTMEDSNVQYASIKNI